MDPNGGNRNQQNPDSDGGPNEDGRSMEDIQDTRDREMRGRRESSGDRQGTQSPAEGERVADPTNDDDKDVNDEDQDVL